jgi:iron complex transport system ATP-binding protein
LLLDEPTSALDIAHQELVMELLRRLARDGTTVVTVLHDLNLAAAHTDRLMLLDSGRTVQIGAPDRVLTESTLGRVYRHPVRVVEHPGRRCPLVLTIDRSPEAAEGD